MRQRMAQFMVGRYGTDKLNSFMLVLSLILIIINSVVTGVAASVLRIVVFALLALCYFRMFSRSIAKRREENERYLRIRNRVAAFFRIRRERWIQRKDYKFFSCPSCKTTLRVPRGKGSINVVCRKCGTYFRGKT